VRRDTNTTCAVALTRRMRVFVEDVSTSYLFVGTRELDLLSADGLWGVLTTHFRQPQTESDFNHALLDRLAVQIADSLEQREILAASPHNIGRSDRGH
jgi:GAF domain-containing protein